MQFRRFMLVASTLVLSAGVGVAGPKVNGDGPGDLAPLGKAGDNNATEGPMAHANTPPIGGATQGGGGNPKESGPVDAKRAQQAGKASSQPDNK